MSGDMGISCGFGLIFTKSQIRNFRDGIINIHFGHLPNNRGRHPLSWAFLMNEFEIWTTMHLIDEDIDRGTLLYKFKVERFLDDDLDSVQNRIVPFLGQALKEAISVLKSGNGKCLCGGHYMENLSTKLKSLVPKEVDAAYLLNAVRSQKKVWGYRNIWESNKRKPTYLINRITMRPFR